MATKRNIVKANAAVIADAVINQPWPTAKTNGATVCMVVVIVVDVRTRFQQSW